MELEFEPDDELLDTIFYVRELKDDDTTLCNVCLVDETEDNKHWTRYQLICGHKFHSRCVRRWCAKKGSIHCPLCGDIHMIKANRYCKNCKKFGHCHLVDGCSKVKKQVPKDILLEISNMVL